MLKPEGNAILVAQNTIVGFDTEVTALSQNNQAVDFKFSAELSRARESISDQAINVKQKIGTPADINHSVESTVENTDGSGTVPQSLLKSSPIAVADLKTTISDMRLVPSGVPLDQDGITSHSSMPVTTIPTGVTTGAAIDPNTVEQAITPILEQAVHSKNEAGFAGVTNIVNKQTDRGIQSIANSKLTIVADIDNVEQLVDPSRSTVNAELSSVTNSVAIESESVTSVLAEPRELTLQAELPTINEVGDTRRVVSSPDFSANPNPTAASPAVLSNAVADQADNSALLYKPSPALINSGLGRISVALNPGVGGPPTVNAALLPSVPSSPLQSSSVGVNSLADVNAEKVATVSGHEFLRSVGNVQTEPLGRQLSKANSVASTVPNVDESKQGVSLPAQTNAATPVGLSNAPAQNTLAASTISIGSATALSVESSEPTAVITAPMAKTASTEGSTNPHADSGGAKSSHQQFVASAGTTADEEVTLLQLRESVVAEQQNKSVDVTPGITNKQGEQLSPKADLASLQSVAGASNVTSTNVYHVTGNGIISANSNPLNTGLSGDLVSAPRTLLLDQPGADQSLVDNLRWAVNEKLSRATINVTPANLGPITVSVDVENKNMSVSIITNNVVAKEAIDSLLPRMREHFANEGYQQVSVDVSSQQERQSNLRNQSAHTYENESGSEAGSHNSESAHEENRDTPDHQRVNNSLIDTYV